MSITSLTNPGLFTQVGGWTIIDKTSSDATWDVPSGVLNLNVVIIAGGGGGGSGGLNENLDYYGGAGGAGGNALLVRNLSTSFLTRHSKTVPIVIGAGGAGATGPTGSSTAAGSNGSSGGASSFGPFAATGGGGGAGGSSQVGATAQNPSGGTASSSGFTYGTQILIPGTLSTQEQVIDFFNALAASEVYSVSSPNIETFVGGAGGVGGGCDYSATSGIIATWPSTVGSYPTSSHNITSSSFDAFFSAGGVGGGDAGTGTGSTSIRGVGLIPGFSGGGGGGGGSTDADLNATAAQPGNRGRDAYFGGGGGGAGVRNNNDNRTVSTTTAAGGAGAANSGGGGGGGGSSNNGAMTNGSSYSGSGGNGGSGRVIIFYRT